MGVRCNRSIMRWWPYSAVRCMGDGAVAVYGVVCTERRALAPRRKSRIGNRFLISSKIVSERLIFWRCLPIMELDRVLHHKLHWLRRSGPIGHVPPVQHVLSQLPKTAAPHWDGTDYATELFQAGYQPPQGVPAEGSCASPGTTSHLRTGCLRFWFPHHIRRRSYPEAGILSFLLQ